MNELDRLKLITAYIRQARVDLAEGLADIERSDLARVVPKDYAPEGEDYAQPDA